MCTKPEGTLFLQTMCTLEGADILHAMCRLCETCNLAVPMCRDLGGAEPKTKGRTGCPGPAKGAAHSPGRMESQLAWSGGSGITTVTEDFGRFK